MRSARLRWPVSPADLGLFAVLAACFVFFSWRPLWHTDLWGHLAYGRLIVAQRSIPATEPLMPLARGVPFCDSAWLSQVLGYLVERGGGIPALQVLYAACVTASLGLISFAAARKAGSPWAGFLALGVFAWVDWQQLQIVRPQLGGVVCFLSLFVMLMDGRPRRREVFYSAALFVLWANLHGSFVVGLGLLGAFVLGRAADVFRRTGRLSLAWRDRRTRQRATLFAVAVLAACVNPYGPRLFVEIWQMSTNANLAELVEWRPLGLDMRQGRAAAATALLLCLGYWFTPRRSSCVELFLLGGLGIATLRNSRMVLWWAPLAAYWLAQHAAAAWNVSRRQSIRATARKSSGRENSGRVSSMAALVIGIVAVAATPLGSSLVGRQTLDPQASFSPHTPINATAYLDRHPPEGLVFNTYEWGDYLLWAGPQGIQVFVASHAHLIPREVWLDYLRAIGPGKEWRTVLDRYYINTVVLDTVQHALLVGRVREDANWSTAFEDDRSVVLVRRTPPR